MATQSEYIMDRNKIIAEQEVQLFHMRYFLQNVVDWNIRHKGEVPKPLVDQARRLLNDGKDPLRHISSGSRGSLGYSGVYEGKQVEAESISYPDRKAGKR